MAVHRFDTVKSFVTAAAAADSELQRFDMSPHLAHELLDVSVTSLFRLLYEGSLDAVVTADGQVFLDSGQLTSYASRAARPPLDLAATLPPGVALPGAASS